MASHWSKEVKEFPLSVIADCGILNKMMGKIMIPLTNQGTHAEKKKVIGEMMSLSFKDL